MDEPFEPLRIVIVGHADHGKSTLIGRLLNEAGALPEGGVAVLEELSRKRGVELEWAFVTDALQAERNSGGTIDTSEAFFRTDRRSFVIIDAPGQDEFLRNMITGASSADLAIVVIDAVEGALDRARRQLYLLGLLGVRRLIVAVNKMDKVGYSADNFSVTARQIGDYLHKIDIAAIAIIPITAKYGEMIAVRTQKLDWYHGPTLLEALDRLEPVAATSDVLPLRFSVQDIYKFDERRILAGRIESGVLRVGDTLFFAPGGGVGKVASIEDWNQPMRRLAASAGDTIGITLDQGVFVERGDLASLASEPVKLARQIRLRIFWLAAEPLTLGQSFALKLAAAEYRVTVREIGGVVDPASLEGRPATQVLTNDLAEISVEASTPIPVDRYAALPRTGRAVMINGTDALGGAIVLDFIETANALPAIADARGVSRDERERRNRHRGGVLWLTGLPGSGKSTLAAALERALFDGGMHAVVLDSDRVRQGLSRDLSFEPQDRSENIRRVAETAKLLADAGNIVIVALISPAHADRDNARAIVGDGFCEIYMRADPALCEARDTKGVYARARRGEIKLFTGVDAIYETPCAPDMIIDTGKLEITECIDRLIGFVDARFHDPRIDQKLVEPEWSV